MPKKFGVSLQDLLDANKDALKGKGDKKYFLVGQEIVIPRKIDDEELATLNADRKSAQETTGDYAQQAAVREQRVAEVRARKAQEEAELKELGMTERAKGEVKAHYSKTPDKIVTFKKVANAKNGRSICVDKNGNYVVVAKDGTILKTDFIKNPEKYEQARKLNEEVKTRNGAKGLAKEFYQIADDNSGLNSINKMQKLLDTKVSAKNITQFLDEYDKFKQGDSSIIDTITSEVGASGTIQQKKVLTTLMDKLSQAARAAGVSEAEIKKANADFLNAYNAEYKSMGGAFRRTNPKDMEKAMDSLRGNILAKQNGTGNVDSAEAIKQFKDLARDEHNSAVKDFNKAREEEGWTARVGDTVCGWFGCNTIEDLNKKLGKNKEFVQALVNSKSEAEFRKIYKNGITTSDGRKIEGFGVEFDPNKISARQNAIEKYRFALNCDNTVKAADRVLKHTDSWGYSEMKTAIRNNFKYDNKTIDQIIGRYAQAKGIQNPTDADKKAILVQFLNDTKTNARREFTNIAQGKSLDQMGKDIELITRSAFGTNDIVKDVIQFNENQQITEMVTEAGFEIAGTIALQFVPGLGQMAAARLALSAARWGTKAVKVVNYAKKAEKAFATVNKFQKGEVLTNTTSRTARVVNRGVQIGSQMVNTGIATAGVDLSNGKSVKEATKKALMNMSFAGVGASSSILAPKLMQAFGIADKALATEIAEEIINAAGSYGVTKLEGGEYGSTDAFVDFASGLIISRISHVKGGSKSTVKPQGATTPDVPVAPKVETPNTPAPKAKPETVKADVKPAETPEVVVKPNPEVKPEPVAPTPKKEAATDDVSPTPVKKSDEAPNPEVETPVAPQTKSEFETGEVSPTTAKGMDDLSFDELFGDLNASESEYLSIERKRLMEESGFSEETLADIDFETAVALKDLCKDCDTIMLRYQDAVNNEHFVFERDIYNKPTEYLETDPNAKRMALLILSSNPKYQAIFDRIGANKFIKAETEGLHLPESSTKVKPQENNGNKVHTDAPDAVSNFNDLSFEDIFGDLDSAAGETELRNDRIKNLKSKGFDESLLQEIDTESLSFIDEMSTEIDKFEYLRNSTLTKEDFNLDDIFAHKDYTPEQAEILRSKLQQNPKYKDFFNKDTPDNLIAAPIDNPTSPQKNTTEFEPAHNDAPVSSEVIDKKLDMDNHELQHRLVSDEELLSELKNNGITFDESKKRYLINKDRLDSLEKHLLIELNGDKRAVQKAMEKLPRSLKEEDINNIKKMLNACDGKYASTLLENPDNLILFYSDLKNSKIFKSGDLPDAKWSAIFNLLESPLPKDDVAALMRYKGTGYKNINTALRDFAKNGTPIPDHMQQEINSISKVIATQKVKEPMTVYRTEGMEFFESIMINIDGKDISLAEAMKSCTNDNERANLKQNVLNNKYTGTQNTFTSTSMLKPYDPGTNDSSNIVWELEVQPETEGIYVEGVNHTSKLSGENEFLIQKNATIEITGLEYGSDGKWHPKGKIYTTKQSSDIVTPAPTQPKYTKEFEPAHDDTPVSSEIIDQRLGADNPELQQLGAQYKKLEAQQEELQQQVERLKEQIRKKAQTSADEIDGRFNRSNPELDIMNTKYRSLELQQEKLRAQVEKLKQQMREKVSVNADDIDARLNQRTGDYEDLAADLRNREAVGQRAKKELEPAHDDTPVSSEIIDQRLGADNPELKKLNEEILSSQTVNVLDDPVISPEILEVKVEPINSSEITPQPIIETSNSSKVTIDNNTDIHSQAKAVLNEADILSKSPDELLATLNNDFCSSSEILGKNHITFEKDNIGYTFVYDSNNKLVAFNVDLLDGKIPKFYELKNNKVSEIDFIKYDQVKNNAYEEIVNSKVNSINSKLEKRPNIKEIIDEIKDGDIAYRLQINNGKITYMVGEAHYEIMFDKMGKVLGYSKHKNLSDVEGENYLYNSKGKPEKVTQEKYKKEYDSHVGKNKWAMDTSVADELFSLESTQIDIETLLKNNGTDIPRFNSFTVNELNSLVINADDSRILNALLIDKKFKMPIDSQLNISSVREYTYNCDDIINILKSDKAKAFILDKINSGTSFSKSDLKKLDKDLFFDPSSYKLETKRDLSHTIEDLQLTDNNGNPIDDWTLNYFFEQNSNFRQKIPSGEVANINGHMYVNDGGHLTKLELSKETFKALFPIEERHKINQGGLGDCWLVSSMGALMDSPKGRASIYKMFSQDGNDILVKFPDSDEPIRFKNGKLNNLAPVSMWMDGYKPQIGFGDGHVSASKGIRMLEQAYSIHRNDGYGNANIKDKDIQDIFFMNKQMKRLKGGWQTEAIGNIVGEDHVVIRSASNEKEYMRLVDECIDDPNKIVTFATKHKVGTNTKYDLVSGHAYHIVAFDREKGILSISNPWHNNEIRQIPVRDWLNYIYDVSVMEIV